MRFNLLETGAKLSPMSRHGCSSLPQNLNRNLPKGNYGNYKSLLKGTY